VPVDRRCSAAQHLSRERCSLRGREHDRLRTKPEVVAPPRREFHGLESRHESERRVRLTVHPRAPSLERRCNREAVAHDADEPICGFIDVPRTLGAQVERGIEIRIRHFVRHERRERAAVRHAQRIENRRRQRIYASQRIGDVLQLEDAPVRLRGDGVHARDDHHVAIADGVDRVRRKVLGDGSHDAEHEAVVDLRQVQPLPEYAVRRQVAPHVCIELGGEQA
jgi:hypothetical protein